MRLFRIHPNAASLKLDGLLGFGDIGFFPHSSECGLIEATAGNSPRDIASRSFPHSSECGLIEADGAIRSLKMAFSFRIHPNAASLKQKTFGVANC